DLQVSGELQESICRNKTTAYLLNAIPLPPAGRRCRQADEGRVTANANVSAYGFDPKDPSASLATAGNTDAATPE
ncbi:hypothetical protein, partial [Sinorhizobium meliloti]|uniref:hypothetical protein n=1 Tax=Rhizobium meliloti TaxID=382 RepID=UPI001AEC8E46